MSNALSRICFMAGPDGSPAQMGVALLVEVVVGVAHRLGLAAPEHDLEIDRLQAVVLEPVDHARRTGDAFPGSEFAGQPPAAFVLDEDAEITLQDEEYLLDLVRVRGVALARRAKDDAEREGA